MLQRGETAGPNLHQVFARHDAWHVAATRTLHGEKQRVGIARALVKRPALLLADEPVASLDPVISYSIMKLLRDISKELKVTVVCSLHQVDLALTFADRIIGLSNGRLVLDGSPSNIDEEKIQRVYGKQAQGLLFNLRKRK